MKSWRNCHCARMPSGLPSNRTQYADGLGRASVPKMAEPLGEPLPCTFPTGGNRVVLSTFFAGKWYQIEQNKHHRWKLNEVQIQQYGIGGALAASRSWWEAIPITRRKLLVLAPDRWFTALPVDL